MECSTDEYEWLVEPSEAREVATLQWTTVCYGAVTIGTAFAALVAGMMIGALVDGLLLSDTVEEGVAYGFSHSVDLLMSPKHVGTFMVCLPATLGAWAAHTESQRHRPLHALLSVAIAFGMLTALESMSLFE